MSFASGPVSFRRYLVSGSVPQQIDQALLDKLNVFADADHPDYRNEEVLARFAGGRHLRDGPITFSDHVFADCILFALRIDTNRVPGAEKRSMLLGIEEEFAAANPSGFISKQQKREAKDRLKLQIDDAVMSGRHRKTRLIPLLWDVPRGILYTPAHGDAAARIADLLDVSLDLSIDPVTAGTIALTHAAQAGQRQAYEDLRPTAFAPAPEEGMQPAYPWAARCTQPKDWLGNEFLLWLWNTGGGDSTAGKITPLIERTLQLDCAYGMTGSDTLRGDAPHIQPEARAALRLGKVPRKCGLIVGIQGQHQVNTIAQFDAESFALTSAKLPEVEKVETPRAMTEARIGLLRDLCSALDTLYTDFLSFRLRPNWAAAVSRIRTWIQEAK